MGRLYDFLKEEMNLYQAIEKIELKVKEIMQTNRESYLENHGFSHIERVIKYVEEAYDCYFQKDMPLNSYECFVLLAAIYIHDIGFFLHDEKTIEAFCKHKKIRFCKEHEEEFYRKQHPWLSAYWLEKNIEDDLKLPFIFDGDIQFGYCIMKVIIGHGIDFWKFPEYQKQFYVSDINIRIDYLSYLLCLGDSLDCDKRRNQDTVVNKLELCSVQEIIFFKFQEYINLIEFDKENIILHMNIPAVVEEKKEIINLFIKNRMKWIEYLLNVGNKLFCDIDFKVTLKIYVKECAKQVGFTKEEYCYIQEYLI